MDANERKLKLICFFTAVPLTKKKLSKQTDVAQALTRVVLIRDMN